MNARAIKRLTGPLKLVLAVGLLAWVLSGVQWSDSSGLDSQGKPVVQPGLAPTLQRMHVGWAAVGLLLSVAPLAVNALRWQTLLGAQQVRLTFGEAIRLTALGEFVSMVTPGTVGGDAVKAYCVMKVAPDKSAVLISALADRMTGLCTLAVLATCMLATVLSLGLARGGAVTAAGVSVAVAAGAIGGALAVLLSWRVRRALRLGRLLGRPPLRKYCVGASRAVAALRGRPGVVARVAMLSLTAQALQVGSVWALGLGLELGVEWYRYFLYVPIIMMASSVPVTPGGLGVTEKLYVVCLGGAGAASGALALALLARLAWIVSAIPGAIVLAAGPKLPSAEAIQTELDAAEAQTT